MKRFAPGLVTRVLYGAEGKQVTRESLPSVDVLISTPHIKLPVGVGEVIFHRLVVDESHLLDTDRSGGVMPWGARQLDYLQSIQAPRVWLVTVRESDSNPRPSPFASPHSPCVGHQPLKARTLESRPDRARPSCSAEAASR